MLGRKFVTTGTVAALSILAIVSGCREATSGPSSVKPQDFASSVKLLTGNQQVGTVGAALPEVLTVKVVDAGGLPVAGATVLWQVRDGGGSINPAAATTASTGLATVTWTMGTTLGANKAVAILQGSYVLDSVVFTATAKVGPAQKFVKSGGDLQTARVASVLPLPLVVNVTDQYGYPVVGVKVTWAAALFGGAVTPLADSTDASGNVRANWTLGTSASGQSATATVTGLAPILTFTATGTPDVSRQFVRTPAWTVQNKPVGSTETISVRVTDKYDNVVSGDQIAWNDLITGGGSVSPLTSVTNASGVATATWTIGPRVGSQTLRAKLGALAETISFSDNATVQFASVSAGNYFTCGVTTGDKAYCWGYGENGQRGVGALNSSAMPGAPVSTVDTLLGPFSSWRSLGSGSGFVCGVSISRQPYCWGQLASVAPLLIPTVRTAPASIGVATFAAVQSAETHSCMLTTDGQLACTGGNGQGQLGDGTIASQAAAFVRSGAAVGLQFSGFAVGGFHTCVFPRFNPKPGVAAGDSVDTNTPRCWGADGSGQLGNATIAQNSTAPVLVDMTGLILAWDTTSMVAGTSHTCALTRNSTSILTDGGVAYCWGSNSYGQLGADSTPAQMPRASVPRAVAGGLKFSKLFAGEFHTCGITMTTGLAYCWGRNSSGQLGNNGPDAKAPVAVNPPVTGAVTWRSLSLGELHTCGVAGATTGSGTTNAAGDVYCWGDNEYGQLGTGTAGTSGVPQSTPVRVKGQQTNP